MKKNILTLVTMMFMTISISMFAQWEIDEGFEGTWLPHGWTVINSNGGSTWEQNTNPSYSNTGNNCASVPGTQAVSDDWLITPQVSVQNDDLFIFYARSRYGYFYENFNVKLSTTGTAIEDFTVTLGSEWLMSQYYTYYEYDLSSQTGDVYLAIQCVTGYTWGLYIDDVKVGQYPPPPAVPENVLIVINGDNIELSWRPSANATDYKIEFSTDPYNGYDELTSTTGGEISYTHTDGALGTKYFYRVVAFN